MVKVIDLNSVVKHLVDGTLGQSLCRVCLLPIGDVCENVFTKICKIDTEVCVADVLQQVCNVKVAEHENFNVCSTCFNAALTTYKFYLLSQHSTKVLEFYVDELERNVMSIDIDNHNSNDSLCITLPKLITNIHKFDLDMKGCPETIELETMPDVTNETNIKKEVLDNTENDEDENIVVIISETGDPLCYKMQVDGTLELIDIPEIKANNKVTNVLPAAARPKQKLQRKRDPMVSKQCSRCPVTYRFIAKLKEHMKIEHNVDLFVCKVCKATYEDEQEFNNHLKMHTNIHQCAICDTVFKKRDSIIAHLKWHEDMKNLSQKEGAHVCELCGIILPNEEQLRDHYDKKHDKKYTCFHCGRMYKAEASFEMHIKKHEQHMNSEEKRHHDKRGDKKLAKESVASNKKRWMCATCGRNFVDERALMWHNMLHTNERPYICHICGRGFVSANRRNQHNVCAHTVPTRRCPLCPALFHLRSMVSTHIKKVHLKAHKRRHRISKHQNVFWRTEPVPIQELSVSIQNQILELKANNDTLQAQSTVDPTEYVWVKGT